MLSQATYLWLDGAQPTQTLRCKMRVVQHAQDQMTLSHFPEWGFDGSSTNQANGHESDLILKPIFFTNDPITGPGNYLVLCEVFNPDYTPHHTNKRAQLRAVMEKANQLEPWIGFEQEYTLFKGNQPLGWPDRGYPAPQGPFYCGVGADEVFGRELVEAHAQLCIDANLMIYGTNAEVMPGQWEFQIGYRGLGDESADPLTVSDHLWVARWLLYRIGEEFDISAKLHPKPVKGDWNGAGKHTNFSTKATRDPKTGMQAIHQAIAALKENHHAHINVYGHGIEERLTGLHETASYKEFLSGIGHRGASVRIPLNVANAGHGYFEDRRPCANANPYEVATMLVQTVCCSITETV
ncbi:MAG: glutamine synthetase [Gammaproteobacteria bacterium CG_4_10_14_0_8_um_filter_38_16]|nr:MAG: glutamine synthetase [Gammaproteobacteria bacterium CG_4_10_14_0_8_um_filter_38_16]PJA03610.1 MAG: glutamine synthetase [Gammaproteobacteria bacterium CG_4_10_14_0_2_um_filter_38_22]PJB10459.1 MAG: glutamine synthetase [Gammaproteobacteria bacterium CG_4_9_14_3_um_filter_38_9]